MLDEIIKEVVQSGESYARYIPIGHLTKIRCNEDVLNKLKNDNEITSKFQLNIKRINRWWWSVCFVDRNTLFELTNGLTY